MARRIAQSLPELFLGLLAISVAVVLTAHIVGGTVRDVRRHTRDTVSVTGSARKPISADLARWSLQVSSQSEAAPSVQATRLRGEVATVRAFLVKAGVPADAISVSVVTSETNRERLSKTRTRTLYRVSQGLEVETRDIDVVERTAPRLGELIERGIDVAADPIAYLSTRLEGAKLAALDAATQEVRRRAQILVHGLGGKLGRMRTSSQGVFQVTPRDSTDVSDYGINDTSTREKDVTAVISATFDVKH